MFSWPQNPKSGCWAHNGAKETPRAVAQWAHNGANRVPESVHRVTFGQHSQDKLSAKAILLHSNGEPENKGTNSKTKQHEHRHQRN